MYIRQGRRHITAYFDVPIYKRVPLNSKKNKTSRSTTTSSSSTTSMREQKKTRGWIVMNLDKAVSCSHRQRSVISGARSNAIGRQTGDVTLKQLSVGKAARWLDDASCRLSPFVWHTVFDCSFAFLVLGYTFFFCILHLIIYFLPLVFRLIIHVHGVVIRGLYNYWRISCSNWLYLWISGANGQINVEHFWPKK